MKVKQLMALLLVLASQAFAQDDFSGLQQKTEAEVCDVIKQDTSAQSGTCQITSWTDLSYVIEYKLSGRKTTVKQEASRPPISGLQQKNWKVTTWTYELTGKTSCNLDPAANRWSCTSTIDPFQAQGDTSNCSCSVTGFAGCTASTRCFASFPITADGLTLIGGGSVSRVVTGYNETHLFH